MNYLAYVSDNSYIEFQNQLKKRKISYRVRPLDGLFVYMISSKYSKKFSRSFTTGKFHVEYTYLNPFDYKSRTFQTHDKKWRKIKNTT